MPGDIKIGAFVLGAILLLIGLGLQFKLFGAEVQTRAGPWARATAFTASIVFLVIGLATPSPSPSPPTPAITPTNSVPTGPAKQAESKTATTAPPAPPPTLPVTGAVPTTPPTGAAPATTPPTTSKPPAPTPTPSPSPTRPPVITPPAPPPPPSVVVFNLYTAAPNATWSSGTQPLTFGAQGGEERGFVRYVNGFLLEDNSPRTCLSTHPAYTPNGIIRGQFNVGTVASGHRLLTAVGFVNPPPPQQSTTNGVTIRILFNGQVIYQGVKTRTGQLMPIDVGLAQFVGQPGILVVEVGANGDSNFDWLCWVNARIAQN